MPPYTHVPTCPPTRTRCCSTPRLHAASRLYLLQNSGVAVSACTALGLLATGVRSGPVFWALLAATVASGCLASVGGMGSTLSVEREWTKALCGHDSAELARVNSGAASSEPYLAMDPNLSSARQRACSAPCLLGGRCSRGTGAGLPRA